MKLLQFAFATTAIPVTYADFWMVYQHRHAQIGRTEDTAYGASFVNEMSEWTCENDTFKHRIFPDRRNVSGDNHGIQFEPWNPQPGPLWHDPLWDVKLNLDESPIGQQSKQTVISRTYHWSAMSILVDSESSLLTGEPLAISIDNNYAMIDASNNTSGQCYVNRTVIFGLDCWFQHPDPSIVQFQISVNGSSMLFYESDIEVSEDVHSWKDMLQGPVSPLLPTPIPLSPPKTQ
ncbi:hypothetical protein CIB48_g11562 [Xylaria polymorpha]|nr:hypothetical protein CIB48_g11562 [Xylaria polymorpha]